MASSHTDYLNFTSNFDFITEKLHILLNGKHNEIKLINNYLCDLNKLDYRFVTSSNSDRLQLLIKQLCIIATPMEIDLITSTSKLLVNVIQNNVKLQYQTIASVMQWISVISETGSPDICKDVNNVMKCFLINIDFNDINHYFQILLEKEKLLKNDLLLSCLEAFLTSKCNERYIRQEFIFATKNIVLNILSSSLQLIRKNDSKLYYAKDLTLCLRIIHIIIVNKQLPHSIDFMGEILGIVQALLFYGIEEYELVMPQCLRPAAMNLPEQIHVIPKCKNLKNHKTKGKKQSIKKTSKELKNNITTECKNISMHSSDSDISDTESANSMYAISKVRLEAIHLLQVLVENSQSREIFGFWPQIVATGSQSDARVLTRCILKEPISKVKQSMLNTLTELLIDAKPFLVHAEDTYHTSFITFFGTVGSMIKELHFTLSLVLSSDKNIAVLTSALKCSTALIQGTPYARLKTGLATKLMRNCSPYIFHKDATICVAALSTFEAVASCDPLTPEIFNILAKQSKLDTEAEQIHLNASHSDNTEGEEEGEEVDIEDLKINESSGYENKLLKGTNVCFLIHVCLKNISNKMMSLPVRLQSLKLLGRMAFNTRSLVFPYMELITATLATLIQDYEIQVILHACRTLEIMAGCLLNDSENSNALLFWNIIFEPVTSILQHSQTILREVACACLGSISPIVFTQQPRKKTILIITVLFGAVHDEESAVRAAALRALGMLVTLPPLKEETGFLMDLADVICLNADDSNLGVRIKGIWALANLCDCFSKERNDEAEPLPLEILLPKLYQISLKASKDSDKVKCNAVRALGTILNVCPKKHILNDTFSGLVALINCATTGHDMKVRWNACRALGLVLRNDPDNILPYSWRDSVFPPLCNLICHSPNFKVRSNAAWALCACDFYGRYIVTVWKSIIVAFENSQHVPSYTEYPHRDTLVQQLCLTLSHVAACTYESDLQNLWFEIGDHVDDISNYMKQFQETIVPEKIGDLIKAKSQLEKYEKSASSFQDRRIAGTLAGIFERTKRYDNLEAALPAL
ncbi:HEAT repeat-containing protein 6 isoform X1 [Megalopta genalis]|uniref:HEAT repeat-containing protein 6 isoform X1 n=1 Tax=Megalopta genalis TaxID=115081 RepID=UPI003FD0F646